MPSKNNLIDVTDKVEVGLLEEESLEIKVCKCGARFEPFEYFITLRSNGNWECPDCGCKLHMSIRVRVFEVLDETPKS